MHPFDPTAAARQQGDVAHSLAGDSCLVADMTLDMASPRRHRFAAVILAAGASTRLGQPKQLVEWQGETLLARAARLAHEAGAERVFVVLGAFASAIGAACRLENAVVLVNQRWQSGMGSSIRAAMHALTQTDVEYEGVLLLVCDQPTVTASHLRQLVGCSDGNSAASAYAGRRGVPAYFPRQVFGRLLNVPEAEGARGLLQEPGVVTLALPDGDFDIDTPQDLASLVQAVPKERVLHTD